MNKDKSEAFAGVNIGKPVINIKHKELTRFGESIFKSECPVCKLGLLLVMRHQESLKLLRDDYCVLCGQRFYYEDIENIGEEIEE